MGHKIHPYGFRLGVIYPWKSNWYAGRDYAEQLHEDIWIRKHIRSRLTRAGISSIDIERKGDQIWVFIRTARPGIVIGRKGAEVDRLRKDIERYTKKRVDVKVEDMNQASSEVRPETDAALLAQGVAEQLVGSRGVPPRDAPSGPDRDALRRARCAGRDRRTSRRHRDGPQGVVPRGSRAAAHAPREGRLRHRRGEDHDGRDRREGLGLPRRRGALPRAGDRAGPRAGDRACPHRRPPERPPAPTPAAARRRPPAAAPAAVATVPTPADRCRARRGARARRGSRADRRRDARRPGGRDGEGGEA